MSVYSGSVTVVEIAPVEERRRSRHFGRSPDVVGKKMSEVASWKGDDAPGDSDYAKGNKSGRWSFGLNGAGWSLIRAFGSLVGATFDLVGVQLWPVRAQSAPNRASLCLF